MSYNYAAMLREKLLNMAANALSLEANLIIEISFLINHIRQQRDLP